MSEKKDTRMMQLFDGVHDLDLLKWVDSEGYTCPARLRRQLISLVSAELKRREHKRESEVREHQARQRAVAAEILGEKEASVPDEPITAYRRVRTMEGWEPLDDLSTELTPCAPSDGGRTYSTWVVYNHARREYVSGAPWLREASVDDNSEALSRAMALVRTVWDRSDEGTTALADHVESHGGDANHWSGVVNWVHGVESEKDELVQRVARWAHDACYSHGSFERMPEASHQRQAWLDGARQAIEGER